MVGREFKTRIPALVAAIVLLAGGAPAQAISMKECSAKYKAAQADGTAGAGWNEFRKQQCAKEVSAATTAQDKTVADDAGEKTAAKNAETVNKAKNLTFPSVVSPKFSAEKPAKARMHTCLEQYHVNKDNHSLDGVKWIEKGGGYYKLCNAKLKGST